MKFMQVTLGRSEANHVPMIVNIDNIISIVPTEDGTRSSLTLTNRVMDIMEPFDFLQKVLYNEISEAIWVEEPVLVEEPVEEAVPDQTKDKKNKKAGDEVVPPAE